MTKITIALLSLIALLGLQGVATAQTTLTRLAYEQCRADAGAWDVACYVNILVEGHDTVVASGVHPKWSPDASRIVFTGPIDPSEPFWSSNSLATVQVLNVADSSIVTLTDFASNNWAPVWSRDGSKIAFISQRDGSNELYVMDANGANPRRVTENVGFTDRFGWSPDNSRFVFTSYRDGTQELYAIDADGSNLTRLTNNVGVTGPFSWSSDGTRIAFDCDADICAINGDGTHFVRLTSDPASDSSVVFSPVDGRIAFVTDRFGAGPEIAVMDPDGNVTRVAPGTGGRQPVWSPDARRLAFGSTTPNFYSGTCYFGGGAHNADEFCVPVNGIYVVNADGTALMNIAGGESPDWFRTLPGQPLATFTYQCSSIVCDFDATGSFDPDGTIAIYQWRFGDGTIGSGPTAHHDYGTANNYNVSLMVTDNGGATGFVSIVVPANAAPIASVTVTCNGPTCAFDSSGSSDPDGTIAHYEWFFGDGNWGGTAATANHTYRTGTYSAMLVVTDNSGATATKVATVSVVNAPPLATFTSSCTGMTCTFDASASSDPDGTIWYYSWTFGDGTTGGGAIASHTFAAGATYTVTLLVDDLYGTGSASRTVTIAPMNAPPVASFTSVCTELTCALNGSGSSDPDGTIASYGWKFGDGATASGVTPSHAYSAGGSYTVTLTVIDNQGAQSQTSRVVTVTAPPPAMHVADLDASSATQQNTWTAAAKVTIHSSSHNPIANAVISGKWNDGSASSCTTNASGQCSAAKSGIAKKTTSVTFTVTNVAVATFVYKPAENHDPDGDSNGTAITIVKR
ncbi:MAG TPA: PKD domain-containing protein [Vicinamibacterales bacterium]|nr:PKD domain-containing protein [Vicinamibacterales bacterium]